MNVKQIMNIRFGFLIGDKHRLVALVGELVNKISSFAYTLTGGHLHATAFDAVTLQMQNFECFLYSCKNLEK
jgi:hypothetical protein